MPKGNNLLDQITGRLISLGGISSKAMFGGFGIFHEGAMFGIIKGTGLFFKVNDSNRLGYEKAGSNQYKPMPYYQVPTDVIDNPDSLLEWARASIKVAHETPTKKKQK
jgi:DNA transformation protein